MSQRIIVVYYVLVTVMKTKITCSLIVFLAGECGFTCRFNGEHLEIWFKRQKLLGSVSYIFFHRVGGSSLLACLEDSKCKDFLACAAQVCGLASKFY
jgi:hypothetical protein